MKRLLAALLIGTTAFGMEQQQGVEVPHGGGVLFSNPEDITACNIALTNNETGETITTKIRLNTSGDVTFAEACVCEEGLGVALRKGDDIQVHLVPLGSDYLLRWASPPETENHNQQAVSPSAES